MTLKEQYNFYTRIFKNCSMIDIGIKENSSLLINEGLKKVNDNIDELFHVIRSVVINHIKNNWPKYLKQGTKINNSNFSFRNNECPKSPIGACINYATNPNQCIFCGKIESSKKWNE